MFSKNIYVKHYVIKMDLMQIGSDSFYTYSIDCKNPLK